MLVFMLTNRKPTGAHGDPMPNRTADIYTKFLISSFLVT